MNAAHCFNKNSQAQLDVNSLPSVKELREKFERLNMAKQLGNGFKRGLPRQLVQSFHQSVKDSAKKPAITSVVMQSKPFVALQPQNSHEKNTSRNIKARFIKVEDHCERSEECRVKKSIKKCGYTSKLNAIEVGINQKNLLEQIANKKSRENSPRNDFPDRFSEVISFLDNLGEDLCENCKETINKCIKKIKNVENDCINVLDTGEKYSRIESAVTEFAKFEKTKCKSTQADEGIIGSIQRTLMDEIVEEFQQKYEGAPADQKSRQFIGNLMQTLRKINCNQREKFEGSKNFFLNQSWSSEYDFGAPSEPEPDYEWSKCAFVDSTVLQDDQHYAEIAENCPGSKEINKSWSEDNVYWVPVKKRQLPRTSTLRCDRREYPREKLPNISPIEKKCEKNRHVHFDNSENFETVNFKKSSKNSRLRFPKFL